VIAAFVVTVGAWRFWRSNRTRCQDPSDTEVSFIESAARYSKQPIFNLEGARQYGPVTMAFEWPIVPGLSTSDLPQYGPGYIVVAQTPDGPAAWAFDATTGEGGSGATIVQGLNDPAAAAIDREARPDGIATPSDIQAALACLPG
jgi:hypothetical protein